MFVLDVLRPFRKAFDPVGKMQTRVHWTFVPGLDSERLQCSNAFKHVRVERFTLGGESPPNKLTPPFDFLAGENFVNDVLKEDNGMSRKHLHKFRSGFVVGVFRFVNRCKAPGAPVQRVGAWHATKMFGEIVQIDPTPGNKTLLRVG